MLWIWVGFIVFVLFVLALDLGVFHRKAHAVSMKEALGWSDDVRDQELRRYHAGCEGSRGETPPAVGPGSGEPNGAAQRKAETPA